MKTFTNEGATGLVTFTLPAASIGRRVEVVVQDVDGVKMLAGTGDTIRLGSTVSGTAGYAQSTQIGATLKLVCINATEWVAEFFVGTWSVV